jgi:hypothetical protein
VDDVPRERRLELRSEIQTHLEALVEARQEMGASPEAAVDAALAQFGDPARVGREWAGAWKGKAPRSFSGILYATVTALALFGTANSMAVVLLMMAQDGWRDALLWGGLFPTVAFLLPALAGLATGLIARKEAVRASLYALLLILPTMTIALPHLLKPIQFDDLVMIGWLRNLYWLPVGCGAAALAGRLRPDPDAAAESRPTAS